MNEALEDLIKVLFLTNDYDITSVSFGYKKVNNLLTDEESIVFGVKKKKLATELPDEKIIPSIIEVDGDVYTTDVNEESEVVALATFCYNTGDNAVPPNVPMPVRNNRSYSRPLSGGISGHASPRAGFVYAGTLGGLVLDLEDNKVVALTNNHIGGSPGGSDAQAAVPLTLASSSTLGARASAYRNIAFYQPSSWDRGIVDYTPDVIGIMKRAYPFAAQPALNKFDACLINCAGTTNRTSVFPLSAPFSTPVQFATTAEINGLTLNDPVFQSGRTTGSIGSNTCALRVTSKTFTTPVGPFGAGAIYSFSELLKVESPVTNTVVASGGDSGALVYACINSSNPATSAWRLIGMTFGAAADGSYSVSGRIDNIANLLRIGAWSGDTRSDTPSLCSYIILDYTTYSSAVTAKAGGKTYWQLGRV